MQIRGGEKQAQARSLTAALWSDKGVIAAPPLGFVVIIPILCRRGSRLMPASFNTVGIVGRSQQQGLEEVLLDLIGLLREQGREVVLEERHATVLHPRRLALAVLGDVRQRL